MKSMKKTIQRTDGPVRDLATGIYSPASASGPLSPISVYPTVARTAAAGGGRCLKAIYSSLATFALLLASVFLAPAQVEAQGLETFDSASLTGSYVNGSFVGSGGITWSYVHSRDEGTFPIAEKGIMLRRADEPSSLSATIPGGVGDFSVDTRKAFTGNAQRRLELLINGVVVQQFEPAFGGGGDDTIIPFIVTGINTEGDVTLTLRLYGATGNQQMVLDNVSWTPFPAGDNFVEAPVFSVVSGLYFSDQVVFVSNFTSFAPGTEVRYTTDGSDPTASSALYNHDFGILIEDNEAPVTLKAIALNGANGSLIIPAFYTFPVSILDIATLRAQPTGSAVYRLANEATLTAQTSFRNTKIFQDASGFGIQMDDSSGTISSVYSIGDNVSGLVGRINLFQGQLQMVPVIDPGPAVSSGNVVVPVERTLAALSFDDQSRLVVISDVSFNNGDGEIVFGGGGAETPISDPSLSAGTTGIFRNVVGESNITGSLLPTEPVTITGFIQQNTRGLTLASRDLADIIAPPPTEGDGAGVASLSNVTDGSPYFGRRIFGSAEPQTLAVDVTVGPQSEPLRAVSVALPAGWSGLSAGNVAISGPGFQGASVNVVGNTITVFNTDLTLFASGTVTIAGVNVPSPEEIEDYGSFAIEVATAIAGGELSPIKLFPRGSVVIPIELLREVDGNGVPLAIGKTVAVSGAVTLEGFIVSSTALNIYIQDETAGVFVSGGNLFDFDFINRGEEFTVFGRVGVARGLTQVEVQANGGLTSVGFIGEPEPQVLSINQALAKAEALEGSLVRLQSLTRVGGTWPQSGGSANLTMRDSTGAELTLRINAPADISLYPEPVWPSDVIGVFGQFAQANPPFSGGYQIVPREYFDFVEATEIQLAGFDAWQDEVFFGSGITDPLLLGLAGDPDGDGVPNLLEYALGGNPLTDSRDLLPLLGVDGGGFLTLTFNRLVDGSDLVYLVDASDDLSSWTEIWSSGNEPVLSAEPIVSQVVSDTVEADSLTTRFLRLRVELQ